MSSNPQEMNYPQRCGRSLTEPPGRPKVFKIAGELRSAVSAGWRPSPSTVLLHEVQCCCHALIQPRWLRIASSSSILLRRPLGIQWFLPLPPLFLRQWLLFVHHDLILSS
jgi:hypothetical protein